jgi:uncharacterized protein
MLRVDLRAIVEGPVETDAVVAVDDPLLAELAFALAKPLHVSGRLTDSGVGRFYWHGKLRTTIAASCRRCLTSVAVEIRTEVRAVFADDSGEDDPSTYLIARDVAELDLGSMVREELLLAVPEYVLCREGCQGLCARGGKDLNEGPCACEPEADPRWAALRALQEKRPQ